MGTATVLMGSYWARPEWLAVSSRFANLTKSQRFMTLWRLYSYETLLEGVMENFQNVPFGIRESTSERASLASDGI